jgi:hypothetical protein
MRIVAVASFVLLLAGCGGSSGSSLGSVTRNDLAIMVLPAAELGSAADGARVEPDSGFQDAAAVAEDTLDPDDTATGIEAAGMEADYELAYTTDSGQVSTEVALLRSAGKRRRSSRRRSEPRSSTRARTFPEGRPSRVSRSPSSTAPATPPGEPARRPAS